VKQLFKINWENGKFRVLSKEYISVINDTFKSKNIFYEDFLLDSINIDLLDIEEHINDKNKKNRTPVYFNNKILGYKVLSYEDTKFNYPLIDNYKTIDNDINLYNNIAFVLSKNKLFSEAIYILEKVIKIDASRVVAYLNIADSYWETNQKVKAIENYKKYVQLMKEQKKDLKKIPKYVYERIKS
jgi:tetratricopeptide (TPR) repeat protein